MEVDVILQEIFGNILVKCFFGNIQLEDIQREPPIYIYIHTKKPKIAIFKKAE